MIYSLDELEKIGKIEVIMCCILVKIEIEFERDLREY